MYYLARFRDRAGVSAEFRLGYRAIGKVADCLSFRKAKRGYSRNAGYFTELRQSYSVEVLSRLFYLPSDI